MVIELLPGLYQIEVPLPGSPLKAVNSYVVRSEQRNLVIDTGLNCEESYLALTDGFKQTGMDLTKTDFFITHFHPDHFGLLSRLISNTTRVYFNQPESAILKTWEGVETIFRHGIRHGFPEQILRQFLEQYFKPKLNFDWVSKTRNLQEGDRITISDYQFECIETPGHSPGHMCLYEPFKKILISGDHILEDISSAIHCRADDTNPLADYLKSLDKVYGLEINLVLPGHRRVFKDHQARICHLVDHHKKRLIHVRDVLGGGPATAFEVASRMHWDIQADNWNSFPKAQQWFATGEALSHLRYLEEEKKIRRFERNGAIHFAL